MNTGEVKRFSMRKELPAGNRELQATLKRDVEKREGPHMKERGGSLTVDWSQCRSTIGAHSTVALRDASPP